MLRRSESRFLPLACFIVLWLGHVDAHDPFGDVLPSNSELWKSFQEEMKTLEQAAHRVNDLLNNAQHQKDEDQEAKAAESPDVTVLAGADKMKDGVLTQTEGSKAAEPDKKKEETKPQIGGTRVPPTPHLNFGSLINSFGFFKNFPEPWWKGKNVCVEKTEKVEEKKQAEENDEDKHFLIMGTGTFQHCKQTSGKYICTTVTSTPESTKTVSTTYQCCEGFRRQTDGCVQVDLKDPVEVLASVGSKDFASLLKSDSISRTLAEKNITIFAPVDSAMRSHHVDFQESNQIRARRAVEESVYQPTGGSESDLVLAHITENLLDVDDFTNEMIVKSSYKDSPLRINIYPGREEPVITVNCAQLQSMDNVALHARVHTVDRVLKPVSQSVVEILDQPQFSQFRQYLEQEGLLELLANASAVTVFAPNNDAWDKLGAGLKDKYSRGEACIERVLRHHILPLTLCAAPASEGRLSTADLDGELVRLSRDGDNQLMVDDKGRVVQTDIVATNGVVHVLDKVLTPKSAKPLSELLVSSNHTSWLELLDRAGLMEELDRRQNVTVFVPTEQALASEETRALVEGMDRDTLREVLLNHVTAQAPTCELSHNARLRSETGNDLLVTLYNPYALFSGLEPKAAVQCIPLGHTDGKACHVVAHEVTQLLLPPNSTTLQLIADNPQFAVLERVVEGTQFEKDLETKSELLSDGFTLLAPSDEAFNKLDEELLSKLLTDKKFANDVLRMHLLKEPVCCASISSVPWPFTNSVRTIDDKKIEVNRDRKNRVQFGNSVSEKCDVITTDGIVHVIDTVLLPETSRVKLGSIAFGTPNRQIMLFGI